MLQSPTESLSIEKKAQNFITPCPTCSIANIVQMWLLLFYFPFLFFFFLLWNVSFPLTNLVLFLPFDFFAYCKGIRKFSFCCCFL